MKTVCLLTLLCVGSQALNSCNNADVFEDLLKVMLKMKCTGTSTSMPKPAFFVTLAGSNLSLGANVVVKFDTVVTNEGKGFDLPTGIFTVPVDGVYEIAANYLSGNSNWLELNLVKNGQLIIKGHAALAQGTAGSLQAVLRLEKGDKLYLLHPRSSGQLYGSRYSMMSGHLI